MTGDPKDMQRAVPRKRRRRGRFALFALLTLVLGIGIAGSLLIDRPVNAPPWVRERIEARIAQSLPGIRVDFGRMSLLVQRSGLARIILWDVDIRNPHGEVVAQLSDIEAGISPGALLNGKIELREAQVSGAFVTLRRDGDGRLGLALGNAFGESTDMPDISQIIAQVDAIAADPRLAQLQSFEADALTLRYEDQRARRGWTADGGRLRLAREDGMLRANGDVALLAGGDGVATVEVEADSPIGSNSLDFSVILHGLASHDIATQSPALAWLRELDAPISGALRSALDDGGVLQPLEATLQIGAGALKPTAATRALAFDAAETSFTYTPEDGVLRFQRIHLTSPLGQVTAAGTARLNGVDSGWPNGLTGQFALTALSLAQGAVLERPMTLSGADMAFKVQLDPFVMTLGELRVTDPGYPLRMTGQLSAEPEGWRLALDANVSETSPQQILSFWPSDMAPGGRGWVTDNVKSGRIQDVHFALRAAPGDVLPQTFLDLGFSEGRATYNPHLPGLTGAAGRLTIHDGRLGLRLDAGETAAGRGPIDIAGTEFVIADLDAEPIVGEVRLEARGGVTAALAYLNNDSWRLIDKADRTVDMASGAAEVTGRIAMPLIQGLTLPQVTLNLAGTLRDVDAPTAIPGKPLTADQLALSITNEAVALEGAVLVDGVPARGRWARPFAGNGGEVAADVTLTPESIAALGIGLPPGSVRGRGTGRLIIDMPRGAPVAFELTSDLAGLGLSLPQIGWDLAPGAKGAFSVAGLLGEVPTIERIALSGAGLDATGRVLLNRNGGFDRMELSRLRVGDWLDVRGRLNAGRGGVPGIEVDDGIVDMRSAPFTSSSGGRGDAGPGGGGAPLSLALGSLRLTDSIVFEDFRADFDTTQGLSGPFTARLGGRAPVQGLAVPQNGGTAFRITAEDAGDVLRAAKMLRTVRDGAFQLDLAPVRGKPGHYDGLMRIKGTRLRDAPAIAALLDAISIVGLLDQLSGPGIFFTDVEARFRLTPNRVILSSSSAVGPSMGISLDGYYDLASGRMDMQGVVSPLYLVNGIGSLISRRGEGLIGFNFNLRGTVDKPRVLVNPLSAFTPGMFRDIFRRPPPRLSQ